MKKFFERLMTYFAAAAYAETGNLEMARQIIFESTPDDAQRKEQRLLARTTAPRLRG